MTDVAAEVGLNANYFCSVFEHFIGPTPQSYLIMLRMQQARTLLLTTTDSVQQIAYAVGYVASRRFQRRLPSRSTFPRGITASCTSRPPDPSGTTAPQPAFHKQPQGE
jgi:transcriptional regulator GlxA family with amidase domain